MPKALIDPKKCLRCIKCHAAVTCPVNAIFRIDAEESAIVESNICHGCGDCLEKCPVHAISLKET